MKGPDLKIWKFLQQKHWSNFLLSNIILTLQAQCLLYGLSAAE